MSLEDHRNPNGTYDGIGVMAYITRLSCDDIRALAEQVKANHQKLAGCPWHEFEGYSDSAAAVPTPAHRMRYSCRHCQGEVDASAYHWHQQGRRPMPVGEPQPVRRVGVGYPCQGGPLDGKMLAYDDGSTYRVVRQPPPLSAICEISPPKQLECTFGEYRLEVVGPEQLAWVFQGVAGMKFSKITMAKGNRMLRAGLGQHDGTWFVRIDLWAVGFRLSWP